MSEPILIEIATALAGKAAGALYDLVRQKFTHRKEATAALAAARHKPSQPEIDKLASELALAEAYDPQFGDQLRAHWTAHPRSTASNSGVANTVGAVDGDVVQARDIHGDVTFGT